MMEEGGDWDRRNRLKVYEGLYSMSIRNFGKAADLFLETVSTFTSYELMDYKQVSFFLAILNQLQFEIKCHFRFGSLTNRAPLLVEHIGRRRNSFQNEERCFRLSM